MRITQFIRLFFWQPVFDSIIVSNSVPQKMNFRKHLFGDHVVYLYFLVSKLIHIDVLSTQIRVTQLSDILVDEWSHCFDQVYHHLSTLHLHFFESYVLQWSSRSLCLYVFYWMLWMGIWLMHATWYYDNCSVKRRIITLRCMILSVNPKIATTCDLWFLNRQSSHSSVWELTRLIATRQNHDRDWSKNGTFKIDQLTQFKRNQLMIFCAKILPYCGSVPRIESTVDWWGSFGSCRCHHGWGTTLRYHCSYVNTDHYFSDICHGGRLWCRNRWRQDTSTVTRYSVVTPGLVGSTRRLDCMQFSIVFPSSLITTRPHGTWMT